MTLYSRACDGGATALLNDPTAPATALYKIPAGALLMVLHNTTKLFLHSSLQQYDGNDDDPSGEASRPTGCANVRLAPHTSEAALLEAKFPTRWNMI